ncbi:MAG: hypothetical protein ACJ8C4_13665 [Gemmataceae bacterium]
MAGMGLRLGFFFLIVGCLGCGSSTATVSGKVSYHGQPVLSGVVICLGPDGLAHTSVIQTDGTYLIDGVSQGKNKIGVTSPDPLKARSIHGSSKKSKDKLAATSAERASWFPLPASVGDPDKSGLACEVTTSKTEFDIEIP